MNNTKIFCNQEITVPVEHESFSLKTINEGYVGAILKNNFSYLPSKVKGIKIRPVKEGLNAYLTGGGVFKIEIDGFIGGRAVHPMILKWTPSFKRQQQVLYQKLEEGGCSSFVPILNKYPSNRLSIREIMSYLYLPEKIALRMPKFFLGVINEKTEESWIFMEDLSRLKHIEAKDWTLEMARVVLKKMADFHSIFWGKETLINGINWLGRWWGQRNNDYVASDVASYAVQKCAEIHSGLLTKHRIAILERVLEKRHLLHELFTQEPQTVIHWDFGPQNICFAEKIPEENEFVVFDWQTTSVGVPQWDIAQLLIPILGVEQVSVIYDLIDDYISALHKNIKVNIQQEDFRRTFDLVVLDHFFRVCGPILVFGDSIDTESGVFSEWKNCLRWIEEKSIASFDSLIRGSYSETN